MIVFWDGVNQGNWAVALPLIRVAASILTAASAALGWCAEGSRCDLFPGDVVSFTQDLRFQFQCTSYPNLVRPPIRQTVPQHTA